MDNLLSKGKPESLTGTNAATMLPMAVLEHLIQMSPIQNRISLANTLAQVLQSHGITEVSPKLYELLNEYSSSVGTDFEWIYPRRRTALSGLKRVNANRSLQTDIPGYYLG